MALELPAAPANFYTPSLQTLKDAVTAVNGSTKGKVVLLSSVPTSLESCWAEVGVAGNTIGATNRGTKVAGSLPVGVISNPIQDTLESTGGEYSYKLHLDALLDVPVYIDGSGVSTTIIVGIALIEGVDLFVNGTNSMVRYIFAINPITVTDGSLINVPAADIIIGSSTVI